MEISDAIKIAKVIAMAPDERLPLILAVFEQAGVDIDGLEILEEWRAFKDQAVLIDAEEVRRELIDRFDKGGDTVRILPSDFNAFCKEKKIRPTPTKRMLARCGMLKVSREHGNYGKLRYSTPCWIDGKNVRCIEVCRGADEIGGGNGDYN